MTQHNAPPTPAHPTSPPAPTSPAAISLDRLLQERFGWSGFRPMQRQVIESVVAGNSCLAVMPTGAGKSLCYQLPALALPGITVVISPLISLMKDQVDGLVEHKIAAVAINSHDTGAEMERKLADVQEGQVRLVYVAPERLKNAAFVEACRAAGVSLLAVDEAHCISQWGHDFRPDYRFIQDFRHAVGSPPLLALTATATQRVQQDIAAHLGIERAEQFLAGVDRPNLWLGFERCKTVAEKRGKVVSLVERSKGSTIVYVSSRRDADELAALLEEALGESVEAYHAGLDADQRTAVQNRFMAGLVRVVTATNAFGMGIDKADIRAVVHAGVPESIEAYFQEVGRAGRDGEPAECTMVLVPGMDVKMREYLLDKDEPTREEVGGLLQRVMRVAEQGEGVVPLSDAELAVGTLILSHLQALGQLELIQRTNAGMRVRAIGDWSAHAQSSVWGQIQQHIRAKHDRFRHLRSLVYLDEEACRRRFVLRYFGESPPLEAPDCCSACDPRPVEARRLAKRDKTTAARQKAPEAVALPPADPELLARLKEWRREKAAERNVPAYVIFGDRDLTGIAAAAPRNRHSLAACRGVGPTKLELYGDEILGIVNAGLGEQLGGQESTPAALFEQGLGLTEIAATLDIDRVRVWNDFLSWVVSAEDEAWKDQVRRLLSPSEYVEIRSVLRELGGGQASAETLGQRFDGRKVELTRAVMKRVGEL